MFGKEDARYLADCHMHTAFSGDSNAPMKDMIEAAIKTGLNEICITDHLDYDYARDLEYFLFDLEEYFSCIEQQKEQYKGRIKIKAGVEFGLQPQLGKRLKEVAERWPFDFIIGSSHVVDGVDPYYSEYWEGKKVEHGVLRYYESMLENIESCADFDVYGHIDYIIRYCPDKTKDFSYRRYAELIDECLKKLIDAGKGIEVNTGGFKYGLGHPNPHEDILKRYHELGGEILTVGSDAHEPAHVGFAFQKIPQILKNCGFRYTTVFRERKAEFYPIV